MYKMARGEITTKTLRKTNICMTQSAAHQITSLQLVSKYMYIQYFSIHCQIKYQKNKLLFRDREPEKLWKRVLKGLFTSNFAKFLLPIFDEPKKLWKIIK